MRTLPSMALLTLLPAYVPAAHADPPNPTVFQDVRLSRRPIGSFMNSGMNDSSMPVWALFSPRSLRTRGERLFGRRRRGRLS